MSSFVLDAKFGFAQGFDVYEDDFDAATASFAADEWEGHEVPEGFDRRGDATTEMAIRWLREDRDPAQPFLLFVHYFDPHAPYVPPDEYVWRFHSLDRPTTERMDQLALRYGAAAAMVAENAIRRYDGEVAFTDREIGRLLKALDRAGLADRTLVVITADHGEGLMDHGYLLHGLDLHEESVRVPLLFRWRGTIPAGLSFPEPVELVDLAPTILELVGIDWRSKGLPGQSLAPALRGGAGLDPDRPVYLYRRRFETERLEGIRLQGEQYGIRVGKWKYIESPELGRVELYDLERDPRELENLFSSRADDGERIARRLAEWKRTHERTGGEAEVSEDDRLRLEALGYVE